MIKNYFKIAWRNLWRNKTYSIINILGLTAGTVCCLYILLYVKDQYSFDDHPKHAERGSQGIKAAISNPVKNLRTE